MQWPWTVVLISYIVFVTLCGGSTFDPALDSEYPDDLFDKTQLLMTADQNLDIPGGIKHLDENMYGPESLDGNVYGSQTVDGTAASDGDVRSGLLEVGKRGWRSPSMLKSFSSERARRVLRQYTPANVIRRRAQQLSVSGPLSALANMLAAETRRRKQHESLNNRMRLLELGKRSEELLQPNSFPVQGQEIPNDDRVSSFLYNYD